MVGPYTGYFMVECVIFNRINKSNKQFNKLVCECNGTNWVKLIIIIDFTSRRKIRYFLTLVFFSKTFLVCSSNIFTTDIPTKEPTNLPNT